MNDNRKPMDDYKEISFIARHYRKGLFAIEPALRRVRPHAPFRIRFAKIAAASAVVIFMSAAAAVMLRTVFFPQQTPPTEQSAPATNTDRAAVKVIDFESTPLPVVVAKIQEVYGVEITDIPADAESYTLSLHYEGTAADLVATINEILDTDMKINQ